MAAPTLQPYLAGKNQLYSQQQCRRDARNPLWNRYRAATSGCSCAWRTATRTGRRCATASSGTTSPTTRRFAGTAQRAAHHRELVALLDEALLARTVAEWLERLAERGLAAGPINNLKDVAEDPQAWANDYLVETACAEVNRDVDIRGLPITLSKTPGRVESLGPELGQDTELILMETLEMDWERIEDLKAKGVIP